MLMGKNAVSENHHMVVIGITLRNNDQNVVNMRVTGHQVCVSFSLKYLLCMKVFSLSRKYTIRAILSKVNKEVVTCNSIWKLMCTIVPMLIYFLCIVVF